MKENDIITVILVIMAIIAGLLLITHNTRGAFMGDLEYSIDSGQNKIIVTAYIFDLTPIQKVESRVLYNNWINLEQESTGIYSSAINISGLQNGEYKLVTRYYNTSGSAADPFWANQISFTINRPPPVIQYGSISFTVLDTNNMPLNNVYVSPCGNSSNSQGIVFCGTIPLNTNTNFTLTKNNYNTTYFEKTFTDSNTIMKGIIMGRIGGDKREFSVMGYEGMQVGRGTYVLVTDKISGENVNGAQVVLYDGVNVRSIPGTTVNGRAFMSIIETLKEGNYLIEVTASGYKDFRDSFYVYPAPTTPVPSPTTPTPTTPVPTPDKKFRPDVGEIITDDEYREWLAYQENRNRINISMNSTPITSNPSSSSDPVFPWAIVLFFIVGLILVGYKKYGHSILERKEVQPAMIKPNRFEEEPEEDTYDKFYIIRCDKCDWKLSVLRHEVDEPTRNILLENHKKSEHKEST